MTCPVLSLARTLPYFGEGYQFLEEECVLRQPLRVISSSNQITERRSYLL